MREQIEKMEEELSLLIEKREDLNESIRNLKLNISTAKNLEEKRNEKLAREERIKSGPVNLNLPIKAYNGKKNRCMCGCSGKYYVSRIGVNKISRMINDLWEKVPDSDKEICSDYIVLNFGQKTYAVYFK